MGAGHVLGPPRSRWSYSASVGALPISTTSGDRRLRAPRSTWPFAKPCISSLLFPITLDVDRWSGSNHGVAAGSVDIQRLCPVLRVIIALRARVPRGPLAVLLGAWLLVGTGGWAFAIALAVYAFDRSGAGAVGAVTAARLLPAMFAAPLTGGLIDRGDRSRVVAGACVLQAVCLALAGGFVLAGASLVVIGVLAALSSIAATVPRPGLQALLPALACSPQELTRATALWSAVDSARFTRARLSATAGSSMPLVPRVCVPISATNQRRVVYPLISR